MRHWVYPALFLAFAQGAFAQQAPTGGSQIRQIPPAPVPQRVAPQIRIEQGATPASPLADQTPILVKSLRLTGVSVYPETDLVARAGFKPGSELTLGQLRAMAAKITAVYKEAGYPFARAYLPAQDIKDGLVTIAVLEGRYGKVSLRNESNLADSLADGIFDGLRPGDAIAVGPLEQRILLLSDIPGVGVKSTMAPGASVGTTDLVVNVTPGARVTGSVDADNEGNRYTGTNRIGGTLNLNEPTGHGDVLTARVLTSGAGLTYARGSYQAQFGRAKLGVAYANLDYRLGKEFSALESNGTAQIASLYGSYPMIRSRGTNLNLQLAYDSKKFQDRVDSTSTITDKKARLWMASLVGDRRDALGGGGINTYSLTWTSGEIDIRSAAALAADAASVQTNGRYDKWSFNAARLQVLGEKTSLYAAINGQVASKNLDASEKMGPGGAYAVRAYPSGEAFADQGYVLTLEARRQLPRAWEKQPGELQLVGFVDTATVTLNKNPVAAGPNRRTLSGAGLGIDWSAPGDFVVKAYFAHKLGNAAATSAPDKSNRFWIQGVKFF